MTKTAVKLWNCQCGLTISSELVLVSVVLFTSLIVGFSTIRDSVVSELSDCVLSVQSNNQSFSYHGVDGGSSSTAGANYVDALDVADGNDISGQTVGIAFSGMPVDEGNNLEAILTSLSYSFRMTQGFSVWTGAAGFAGGDYSASPYWPGTYTIDGDIVTITLNSWSSYWISGEIILDASDPTHLTGPINLQNIYGGTWNAFYELFGS